MAIDIGGDDPVAMEALARAVLIVDKSVDGVHDQVASSPYREDSEVYRLARSLPPGPVSFDRTVLTATEAARGALDQISWLIQHQAPTSPIVLHSLLRGALVGSQRVVFALLSPDPDTRAENARILTAQEGRSFTQALECYAEFDHLTGLRPESDYLATARQQNSALQNGHRPPGDGAVMQHAADLTATALAAMPEAPVTNPDIGREHVIWLWNTYSGVAHTYSWPRLLPGFSSDRRVPGDFPGDFYMIATAAHLAMCCLQSRLQPGSANTTAPVAVT